MSLFHIVTGGQAGQGYTYDVFGYITSMTDGEGNRTRYGYDALNRLKTAEYPAFREKLSCDQAGNRIRRVVEEREDRRPAVLPEGKILQSGNRKVYPGRYLL